MGKKVTITGGEPLEQRGTAFYTLLSLLDELDINVSIETSGLLYFGMLVTKYPKICIVADYKLPSSGIKFKVDDYVYLGMSKRDVVKFVVDSIKDVPEVFAIVERLRTSYNCKANMVVSPNHTKLEAYKLFFAMREYALNENKVLDIGMNLQMHKYIFNDEVEVPNSFRGEELGGFDYTNVRI